MGTSYLGVDSAAFADQPSNGFATVADNGNAYFANWGDVFYWGRYFGPTDGSFTSMSASSHLTDVQNELAAMRKYYIFYIVPIASPGATKIQSNSSSQGQSDATACCNGIINVINSSGGHLHMPSNGQLRVYLDIEANYTQPYIKYWEGWSTGVSGFVYGNNAPFYPCAYINPNSGNSANACAYLNTDPAYLPYAVWTTQPNNSCSSPSTTCRLDPTRSWGGQKNCPNMYTTLWQYATSSPGGCVACYDTHFPPVDLDLSTSGTNEIDYMLHNS